MGFFKSQKSSAFRSPENFGFLDPSGPYNYFGHEALNRINSPMGFQKNLLGF
jgi:hypothetical protein